MYIYEEVSLEEVANNLVCDWEFEEQDQDALEEHYATLAVAELFESLSA
jgi:hypothetical protein